MSERQIPDFQDEAEEAKWWFDHDDEMTDDFIQASLDGTLTRGTAHSSIGLPPAAMLDAQDISLARTQAARRGLHYQTYLKTLLHDALVKAEQEA